MIWDRDKGPLPTSVPTLGRQFLPPYPCEPALAPHCQTQTGLDFSQGMQKSSERCLSLVPPPRGWGYQRQCQEGCKHELCENHRQTPEVGAVCPDAGIVLLPTVIQQHLHPEGTLRTRTQ